MKTRGRQRGFGGKGEREECKDEGNKRSGKQTKGRAAAAAAVNLLDPPESVIPTIAIKERRVLQTPANTQLIAAAAPPTERTNSGFHDNKQNI